MGALSETSGLLAEILTWTGFRTAQGQAASAARLHVPDMEDAQAIERFLATRQSSFFAVLVDRYKERVVWLVLSVLGRGFEGEAEEVAQDVFVKVFQQLAGFRAESRFSTWLYRIAYREALDRKRRARFRLPHVGESELSEQQKPGPDPLAMATAKEHRQTVRLCLAALPDHYRSALHLHYWMGCSVEEIADLLAAPAGTVKSYLHRGRRLLSRELEKKGLHNADNLF